MSATNYKIGDLVLVTPLIFDFHSGNTTYEGKTECGVITEIEDTLDVWYHHQDRFKYTYTVLTSIGQIRKFFSHEIEPVENAKYYAEPRRKK